MSNGFLMSMSALITLCVGLLLATSKPLTWVPQLGDFLFPPPDPVLVVIVGTPELVSTVRGAIAPERIVADSEDAFALDSLRVIAADADAASRPINQLGWIDREIEVVSVPSGAGRNWERNRHKTRGGENMSDAERARADEIASLVNKPTLNAGEAMTLLRHMDSTGQF